jgi:hypothetical protein
MTHDELAGYTLLAGYGLMVLAAIRLFGFKRVLLVILGIVFLGVGIAFGTFRGVTNRRY